MKLGRRIAIVNPTKILMKILQSQKRPKHVENAKRVENDSDSVLLGQMSAFKILPRS
jgi:hypothetical protein